MTDAKSKRRWFSFSLRTLFVLITVAVVVAGRFFLRRHSIPF